MTKNLFKALFFLMISTLLISCAAQKPQTMRAAFQPHEFETGQYVQKVDNFMVIFDASHSMVEKYKGQAKFDLAKDIVHRMNQTLPDLRLTGALRTFGHGACMSREKTLLVYGMTDYTPAGLEEGIKKIKCAGGNSPLAAAIDAASEDLKSTQGDIAVIIVSDEKDMSDAPVAAAKNMKSMFGDRVCIYPVLVGDDSRGQKLMQKIALAGACGFSVNADEIYSSMDMAGFVEKVFLSVSGDSDGDGVSDALDQCPDTPRGVRVDSTGCALDADGDGVEDARDQCPNTPEGVKVDNRGCPLDTDGDGVYDYLDRCPGTSAGVVVDNRGCALDADGDGVEDARDQCPGTPAGVDVDESGCWVLGGILFDTGKAKIKPAMTAELDKVAEVLQRNLDLKVEIQGHTDSIGNRVSNQKLSEKRAQAVKDYLLSKGIQPQRLTTVGYGLSRPIASNKTPQGRAKNRRVQLKPGR